MSTRNPNEHTKHSDPIPIASTPLRMARARSASMSSASSGTASSPSDIVTPISTSGGSVTMPSPGSSPILSYFLAQSPSKSPTFPFRHFKPAPVFEDEEYQAEPPASAHARRASTTVAGRFAQPSSAAPLPDTHVERSTGILRRLSLSGPGFPKPTIDTSSPVSMPSPPPNSAVSPISPSSTFERKPRRAATISAPDGISRRRAPSPMGERILKGHFDGFN